jgi:glycine cleavage system H protein
VYPDDVKYTAAHEWARPNGDTVRVGITAYAQEALGDIVYAALPTVDTEVVAGAPLGELESTKTWSDVYAPVSGRVVAVNTALDEQPELLNADPYGDGWIAEIRPTDTGGLDGLLDAAAYRKLVEDEH